MKEGYSTVLKCDKVSRSRRMMMVTPLQWPREVCSLEKQQVKKYTPDTSCQKVPKEMCAPRGCGIVEVGRPWSSGAPAPVPGTRAVQGQAADRRGGQPRGGVRHGAHQDLQVASLHLHLVTLFRHVTKLVPRLVPKQECVDVPKEICARSKINPRKVNKPAIQKWCYQPGDGQNSLEV